MTEKEKMIVGQMYDSKDRELSHDREQARLLFQQINKMDESVIDARNELFKKLIRNAGENLWIEPPFYCDYGYNISLGTNVFFNFNCCILDVAKVTIGNNAMLAPGVQILTATHPLEAKERNSGLEYAKPITIGNDVWIGGNAILCPGVTIGNGVVVGAGAVVTKDIPDNVFIGGNPAKVLRQIDNK